MKSVFIDLVKEVIPSKINAKMNDPDTPPLSSGEKREMSFQASK
jgi:hypothetical protein